MKLKEYKTNVGRMLVFHCPGCGYDHPFEVPRWKWNGSFDRPTFEPSLLVNASRPESRCHSYVKEGKIRFLKDSYHALKGQEVEIPEWED